MMYAFLLSECCITTTTEATCGKCFEWALAPDIVGHVSAQKVRKVSIKHHQ